MRRLREIRLRAESGQSMLETAMMITVIFTLVFWIFELGQMMFTYTVIADAANEGVRYAIVHTGGDAAGTQTTVRSFAQSSKHNVTGMTVNVTFPDGAATPPDRVRVTVSYPYVPTLGSFSPTMQTYAEGRMVVP